jgi:hypothetical protein
LIHITDHDPSIGGRKEECLLVREEALMAASDGIKTYWRVLLVDPPLLVFDDRTATTVWRKHLLDMGQVNFTGKITYIAFMQAFMMDGVKGSHLISFLGKIYEAGTDVEATAISVIQTGAEAAFGGILEYRKQMKALETAPLGNTWLAGAKYTCSLVMQAMARGDDVSPKDI